MEEPDERFRDPLAPDDDEFIIEATKRMAETREELREIRERLEQK